MRSRCGRARGPMRVMSCPADHIRAGAGNVMLSSGGRCGSSASINRLGGFAVEGGIHPGTETFRRRNRSRTMPIV